MKFFERKSMPLAISLIFLFMILSRLTWIQVRHYPIEALGFLGPNFLNLWTLPSSEVRSWNINTSIVLFFLAAHMVRFLTRYWFIALFALTVLMSRGVFLARIGWMSLDLTLSMCVVGWFACLAHHVITASHASLRISWFVMFAGTLLESSFCSVALLLPLYRWISVRYAKGLTKSEIPRGTVLKPLEVDYVQWLRSQKKPYKESIGDLIAFAIALASAIYLHPHGSPSGVKNILSFLDLHYVGSFTLIVLCAIYGWKKSDNFLVFQKMFLVSLLLWLAASGIAHCVHFNMQVFESVLLWVEPVLLCLACGCAIYLLKDLLLWWNRKPSHSSSPH